MAVCHRARELARQVGDARVTRLLDVAYRECAVKHRAAPSDDARHDYCTPQPAPVPGIRGLPHGGESVASLTAYLFGAVRVLIDGAPVSWPNGRAAAIFKYLLLHRERPVCRDVLSSVLWPAASARSARNNLNVAMHGLRRALAAVNAGVEAVQFHRGHYRLNPRLTVWVDAEAFTQHVRDARAARSRGDADAAAEQLRAAEAIYQGDLLDEDRYVDWVRVLREQYRSSYEHALDALGHYHLERGDYAGCISVSNKLVGLDPCNEFPHVRLMLCFCRTGQRNLAMRQYRMLVDALARELELAPSRETVLLFERVRRGQPV